MIVKNPRILGNSASSRFRISYFSIESCKWECFTAKSMRFGTYCFFLSHLGELCIEQHNGCLPEGYPRFKAQSDVRTCVRHTKPNKSWFEHRTVTWRKVKKTLWVSTVVFPKNQICGKNHQFQSSIGQKTSDFSKKTGKTNTSKNLLG